MSRIGRVDDAVRLKGSGGGGGDADPGVVLTADVWPPEEEVAEAQLGRNFLFSTKRY